MSKYPLTIRSERALQQIHGRRCRPRRSLRSIRLPAIVSIERVATALGTSQVRARDYLRKNRIPTRRISQQTYALGDALRAALPCNTSLED